MWWNCVLREKANTTCQIRKADISQQQWRQSMQVERPVFLLIHAHVEQAHVATGDAFLKCSISLLVATSPIWLQHTLYNAYDRLSGTVLFYVFFWVDIKLKSVCTE